jgi:arylsulfatase A-like enzyme
MKKYILAGSLFIFLTALHCHAQQMKRPNIILFLVDDMGWQDCSVPFWTKPTEWNKRYHTPNMERLAAEGMKFTNAYATPVCSPSRVSLMTGMNAAHHKVTNWTLRKDQSVDYKDSMLLSPDWNINGMSPVPGIEHTVYATPLPLLLKEAGYYTIHCGKAHFGAMETPASDPLNIGFMLNIAGHAAGGPGINYRAAIRKANWKLVYNMKTGTKELYDLAADIGEMKDVSKQYPAVVKDLSSLLSNRLRNWQAPMPSFKATGKQVPMPDEVK